MNSCAPEHWVLHWQTKLHVWSFKNKALQFHDLYNLVYDKRTLWTAWQHIVIATIPVGYADGLSRKLSNMGAVLIHGHRCPIVGKVCMDQTMVDVTDVQGVRIGDPVVLFGHSDSEVISIDEVAAHMQTINYEVVCLIGKRVPRIYTSEPISDNLDSADQLAQTGAGR